MRGLTRRTDPAGRGRTPAAATLALFALCVAAVAAPAQSPPQASPSPPRTGRSEKSATRAVARPAEPAPSTAAPLAQPSTSQAPTSQPSTQQASPATSVHSEIGQSPIRLNLNRDDAPPKAAGTPATPANASGFDLPRVAGALAIVLALIFALRWILRRSMSATLQPGATSAVQVLSRSPLSPRQQLLLLRVGRRLLVVSDCNGQLSSLSEISDPDEVAALVGQLRDEKRTSPSGSFGNLLGMWRRGGEDAERDDDVDAVNAAAGEEFPRAAPDAPGLRGRRDRHGDDEGADLSDVSARDEIQGLMERVRLISNQFKE